MLGGPEILVLHLEKEDRGRIGDLHPSTAPPEVSPSVKKQHPGVRVAWWERRGRSGLRVASVRGCHWFPHSCFHLTPGVPEAELAPSHHSPTNRYLPRQPKPSAGLTGRSDPARLPRQEMLPQPSPPPLPSQPRRHAGLENSLLFSFEE
ncbi:uncharacterized protein LOC142420803 isoform X2 [Mycteria americana]|uniref:uncharacterized protein LOC142420803 isoform X2 n=1 Tax=Mycteria americana TaxID=33587 RepID=UPI003F58336C